ncbi:MAG: recombinase family protein [Solirubrobacteraceae bacterium]
MPTPPSAEPSSTAPLRYAIYCRVSTAEQAEKGLSLAEQDRRLTEYIQAENGAIVDRYIDAGVSGRSDDRPELQRLLGDVEQIDRVLALSVDRVMRNMPHYYRVRERIEEGGADLVFLADRHDPRTSIGQLTTGVLASIAEWQSNQKSEQVKATTGVRAREGRYHGGPPPYGYRSGGRGQLVVEPGEAAVVERMFTRYAEGAPQQRIARELERDGIPTRRGRWHQGTVGKVLKNPVYRGEVRIKLKGPAAPAEVFPGHHEPLVSNELWERVAELLEASARTPSKGRGRPPKGNHLFTRGFLRCGQCGGSMYPITQPRRTEGSYEVYACYRRKQDAAACDQPIIPRERVDGAVFEYFAREGLDVEATRARLVEAVQRHIGETRALADQAEREAERARSRLARVKRDYQDGKLDADDWRDQRQELADELTAAEANAERMCAQAAALCSAALPDAEEATYRAIASARDAMSGRVRDAKTVEAARAALLQLFEGFTVELMPVGYADEVGLGTGVLTEPQGSFHPTPYEYFLQPSPRPHVIEGWTRQFWPVLQRVGMQLSEKDANGLTT